MVLIVLNGSYRLPETTSSFGRLSVLNGVPRSRYQGADFRAPADTPVYSPNGGQVVLASELYFSGNTIIIDHGLGMFSRLAHLSRITSRRAHSSRVVNGSASRVRPAE